MVGIGAMAVEVVGICVGFKVRVKFGDGVGLVRASVRVVVRVKFGVRDRVPRIAHMWVSRHSKALCCLFLN